MPSAFSMEDRPPPYCKLVEEPPPSAPPVDAPPVYSAPNTAPPTGAPPYVHQQYPSQPPPPPGYYHPHPPPPPPQPVPQHIPSPVYNVYHQQPPPVVVAAPQPTVVVTTTLPPNVCAVCRIGTMRKRAPLWAYIAFILLIPFGLLPGVCVLCLARRRACTNCDYSP